MINSIGSTIYRIRVKGGEVEARPFSGPGFAKQSLRQRWRGARYRHPEKDYEQWADQFEIVEYTLSETETGTVPVV